jgi:hypothetical protein
MKTLMKLSLLAFAALALQAQTATPNTTLCAALPVGVNQVCLTATTSLVNQSQIYVDQELMTVVLSNSQTVCASSCYVPVRRGGAAAGSGPQAHANAAVAWFALTPGATKVPGVNGFNMGTNVTDIGPCTRTAQIYLPKIYPNRGIKRDCDVGGTLATGQSGVWVDYAPAEGLDFPSPSPLIAVTTNGALSVSSGNYVLTTKAGVIALTLAAPTAGVQDGMVITISTANGANADTLTATALLQTGGGSSPYTTATFGATTAYVGSTLTLKAYNGFWYVVSSTGVAFT